MKAWRLPQLGDPWAELVPLDMGEPKAKEAASVRPDAVVVRVEATDLNFADILQCRGQYQVRHEVPFTPGMNATGTVVAASPDSEFRPGARIVGPTVAPWGGFAEWAVLAGDLAHAVPDGVASIDAMGAHIHFRHGVVCAAPSRSAAAGRNGVGVGRSWWRWLCRSRNGALAWLLGGRCGGR